MVRAATAEEVATHVVVEEESYLQSAINGVLAPIKSDHPTKREAVLGDVAYGLAGYMTGCKRTVNAIENGERDRIKLNGLFTL